MTRTLPYGTWPSPLTPAHAAAGRVSRSGLSSDGACLFWLEGRPDEGGRVVLVRVSAGQRPEVVSPPEVSIRSRVHEYGGGAYCLVAVRGGGPSAVAYVDQADQRVWLDRPGAGGPVALSAPAPPGVRRSHGDLRAEPSGGWVLGVREDVGLAGVHRSVVCWSTGEPGAEAVLLEGRDFYSAARPSPTGDALAWVCWDHPDMSWDSSELWVAGLEPGAWPPAPGDRRRVDGGDGVSVGQPLWADDGRELVYVSDREGWWQPWRWADDGAGAVRLCALEAEFHGPDWQLGQSTMARLGPAVLVCRWRAEGLDGLGSLQLDTGVLTALDQPCTTIAAVCAHGDAVAWLGSTPAAPADLWWWPPGGPGEPFSPPPPPPLAPGDVSAPEPLSFEAEAGRRVHLVLYRPAREGVTGPQGSRPPLVVVCHGGPTGGVDVGFDPVVQLFTTRGYAVALVDYAGSSGYGREYRRSLWGRWGDLDVDDCIDAARHLAARGEVDPGRMAIRGASSGGLTALGALARDRCFAVAASWYGVTDLLALAASTHDFESRYLDRLVGPLPAAEKEYRRRSPRYQVASMHGAVLLLQGLDDPVVPPDQATAMAAELAARGVRCELLTFEGESHGFRRADTLERCFEAELAFYRDVMALEETGPPEGPHNPVAGPGAR